MSEHMQFGNMVSRVYRPNTSIPLEIIADSCAGLVPLSMLEISLCLIKQFARLDFSTSFLHVTFAFSLYTLLLFEVSFYHFLLFHIPHLIPKVGPFCFYFSIDFLDLFLQYIFNCSIFISRSELNSRFYFFIYCLLIPHK